MRTTRSKYFQHLADALAALKVASPTQSYFSVSQQQTDFELKTALWKTNRALNQKQM